MGGRGGASSDAIAVAINRSRRHPVRVVSDATDVKWILVDVDTQPHQIL